MEQLIRSNYGGQEHYAHYYNFKEFSHGMWNVYWPNQNPNDFGYIYYTQDGISSLKGTCIYEFDWYSEIDSHYIDYLCDENGYQYNVNKYTNDKYKKFDSEKLIREDDYMYINLSTNMTIYNNYGYWREYDSKSDDFGGGVILTYNARNNPHDNIYVYLSNNYMSTSTFDPDSSIDMTDPNVLNGNTYGRSFAVENEILHAYDMGDCYNYRNWDGSVTVEILFNKIGKNTDTNEYSIFYGFNTWIYIYSSGGNFRDKTARVLTYNYNNQSTPIQNTYTFDRITNNTGYNIIGFPIFSGSMSNIVNYYDITIS